MSQENNQVILRHGIETIMEDNYVIIVDDVLFPTEDNLVLNFTFGLKHQWMCWSGYWA